MTKLIGLTGSLRRGSFNTARLRAAAELLPEGAAEGVNSAGGDRTERRRRRVGRPAPRQAGVQQLDPGGLQDRDRLAVPPAGGLQAGVRGQAVAILGASLGGFGTILSQSAWPPVLRDLGTRPWCEGRLLVSHAGDVFDPSGAIANDKVKEPLKRFVQGFAELVRVTVPREPAVPERRRSRP